MKSWKNTFVGLSIFGSCGCAHLATVKTTKPRVPTITLEHATGFGVFMLKAVLSGRGDEIVDLAKISLFR
jgi:hypothetical protein